MTASTDTNHDTSNGGRVVPRGGRMIDSVNAATCQGTVADIYLQDIWTSQGRVHRLASTTITHGLTFVTAQSAVAEEPGRPGPWRTNSLLSLLLLRVDDLDERADGEAGTNWEASPAKNSQEPGDARSTQDVQLPQAKGENPTDATRAPRASPNVPPSPPRLQHKSRARLSCYSVGGQLVMGYTFPWGRRLAVRATNAAGKPIQLHHHSHERRVDGNPAPTPIVEDPSRRKHWVFDKLEFGTRVQTVVTVSA